MASEKKNKRLPYIQLIITDHESRSRTVVKGEAVTGLMLQAARECEFVLVTGEPMPRRLKKGR